MWQRDDVVRSVRRYLTLVLAEFPGPDARAWEVRLVRGVVADQQRPLGVIETLVQTPGRGRTSIPQGNVIDTLSLVFTGYPALLDSDRAIIEGDLQAKGLSDALDGLIRYGLNIRYATGRRASGPQYLPLWDYSAVPVAGAAGPETPHDVMFAENWSTRAIQDPVDERRFSVILTLTVSWEHPGRVDAARPIAARMPGTFDPLD